jgi:ankyrin repeat/SOCS box protein 14
LIEHGADLEARCAEEKTVLCWIVTCGYKMSVELLLDKGAEADPGGNNGQSSPLFWAAENGHADFVALLLERGAGSESPPSAHH